MFLALLLQVHQVFIRYLKFPLSPLWIASLAGVLRGAFVGREEIRAPLKTPAWEVTLWMK